MAQNGQIKRFLLADVIPPTITRAEGEELLSEVKSLIGTYGGSTLVRILQRRANPDPHTYVGKGKASEIVELVKQERIDVVVVNGIMRSGQIFNLLELCWKANPLIEVWDRVDLILHIFDKHAHTAEAKLQIKLARMDHMGPRMYGLGGTVLSRQGGGIGTRGKGETNIELMKRHWRNEKKKVQDELERLNKNREKQLQRRRERGLLTVSIVGYTNAGKSSLFNVLTGKRKKSEDALFATLDSNVGKMYLPMQYRHVLVSDTIGFIRNLPTRLVDAFTSTLMESVHADVLIHVIDASDPEFYEKLATVEQVLFDLNIHEKDTVYVFNKVDRLTGAQIHSLVDQYEKYHPCVISAQTGAGVDELKKRVGTLIGPADNVMPEPGGS